MQVRVLVVGMVVVLGAGCPPTSRTESRLSISGRVELADVPGLNDLSRVRVDLGRGEGGVTPDENGGFEVSDLEPDVYELTVTYIGGLTPTATRSAYRRFTQRVVGRSGSDVNVGTIRPTVATGTVTGSVTLVGGQAADSATVSLFSSTGQVIDAPVVGGRFQANDVPVGEHTVSVGLPQYATARVQDECKPPVQVTQEDESVESPPMVLAPTAVGLVPGANEFLDTVGDTWFVKPALLRATIRVLADFAVTGRVWRADHGTLGADGGIPAPEPFRPDGYVVDVPEGQTTYLLQFADRCGYESPVYTVQLVRDVTAPTLGLVLLNNGATHVNERTTSLKVVAADNLGGSLQARTTQCTGFPGEAACPTPLELVEWAEYRSESSITFTLGDGRQVVQVQVRDRSGNPSDVVEAAITLDTTPPSELALTVEGNVTLVNHLDVTLRLYADGASRLKVGSASGLAGVPWQEFALTVPFRLPAGDGTKYLYAQFQDEAGNVSNEVMTTVELDTTAPQPPVIWLGDAAGREWTTTDRVGFHVDGQGQDPAAVLLRVWVSGDVEVYFGRLADAPAEIDLLAEDGLNLVRATLSDAAGNESAVAEARIRLDTLAPWAQIFVVNGGLLHTRNPWVPVRVEAPEAVEAALACDGVVDNESFGPLANVDGCEVSTEYGEKHIVLRLRDAAGNLSDDAERIILMDTESPTGSLAVGGALDTPSGLRTTEATVDLVITASDIPPGETQGSGVRLMKLWDDDEGEPSDWSAFSPTVRWTLSRGDGAKTLRVVLQDAVGNEGTQDIRTTITLDRTPPPLPHLAPLPAATSEVRVLAALAEPSVDVLSQPVTYEMVVPGQTDWSAVSFPVNLTLTVLNGPNPFRLRAVDAAGNRTDPQQFTITHDDTSPSPPTIVAPRAFVNDTSVTVNVEAAPEDEEVRFEVCTDSATGTGLCARTCTFAPSAATVSLPLYPGQKTCVFAIAVDTAGNPSTMSVAGILSDLTAPRPPGLSPRYEPGAVVVRASSVDFTFPTPAVDDVAGDGVTPYKGIAHLELDDGAGFSPLCPRAVVDDTWRPCATTPRCDDPRLLCDGATVRGVRVGLAAGISNRVAVRAVDLAGNVGDGVGQTVITANDAPLSTAVANESAPRLFGTTLALLSGMQSRVVELGPNRRADPDDDTCVLATHTSQVRVGAWPARDGVAYVVTSSQPGQVRLRSRGAQASVCGAGAADRLVASVTADWTAQQVAASGTGVAWVEEKYDGQSWSGLWAKDSGADRSWETPDDGAAVNVAPGLPAGYVARGLQLGGACLLWNGDAGNRLDAWHVACASGARFTGTWTQYDFSADTAALSPDGSLLVSKVRFTDGSMVPSLVTQRAVGGAFHAGDPVARRDYPPDGESSVDAESVATDGLHVVSLDSVYLGRPSWVTQWSAGPDLRWGTQDDGFRRMASSSLDRSQPTVANGMVAFASGPSGARDVMALDLASMRWLVSGAEAPSVPAWDGVGTLVFTGPRGMVARARDWQVTSVDGLMGEPSSHPHAVEGGLLLVAEEPHASLHRVDAEGRFFTAGAPPPHVFTALPQTAYTGAYLGEGKGMLIRNTSGSEPLTAVVLEPDGEVDLAQATFVPLPSCGTSREAHWGGISRRHAIWQSAEDDDMCYHHAGSDEVFGAGPEGATVKLSFNNTVLAAWLSGNRMVVVPYSRDSLSVFEPGPNGQFDGRAPGSDDEETVIVTPGAVAHAAIAGTMVAYAALPDTGEGPQVYLYDLSTGRTTQLTFHRSAKWSGSTYELAVAVDRTGRTAWIDSVFDHLTIFGFEP